MGRLIGTTAQYTFLPGHNFQNSNGYDAASNRTSLTAPDGSTNSYNYDTLNRLTTLTNSLTGGFGFGYDALSRRTQLTRPNGINTNYGYDSVSHLLSVLHQAGPTTLHGAGYGYDYAGNRTSKTNYLNGIASNYGYYAIYELQQVTQGGGTAYMNCINNVTTKCDMPEPPSGNPFSPPSGPDGDMGSWAVKAGPPWLALDGEIEVISTMGSTVEIFRSHTLRPWVAARSVFEAECKARPSTATWGSPIFRVAQVTPPLVV